MGWLVATALVWACGAESAAPSAARADGAVPPGNPPPVPGECFHTPLDDEIEANGTPVLPDATVVDWISYADAIVVAEALGEERGADGGYVARHVMARILHVVWEPEPGGSRLREGQVVRVGVLGWSGTREPLRPLRVKDSVRWAVGESYFVPLVDFDPEGWSPMTPLASIPTDGELLETAACMDSHGARHPLGDVLLGKSVAEAAEVLELTPRDPAVEQFRHLRPVARYAAASQAD